MRSASSSFSCVVRRHPRSDFCLRRFPDCLFCRCSSALREYSCSSRVSGDCFLSCFFQFRNSVAPGLQFLSSVLQLLTQLHDKRDQLIPIEFHLRLPVHAGVLPNSRICARPCFAEWTSTIMVVEVENSRIHWMEPRDLKFDKMSFRVNDPSGNSSGSLHKMREWFQIDYVHYAHVMMADGAVHRIPQTTEA